MGPLVLCGTLHFRRVIPGTDSRSLWNEAGRLIESYPELVENARGIRTFGEGAHWMHAAMKHAGWKLPQFAEEGVHEWRGWLKYGVCGLLALIVAIVAWIFDCEMAAPLLGIVAFYIAEAQMVFVFPEALLGNRSPWFRARSLTVVAGGTLRVITTVMPIAAGMLSGFLRKDGAVHAWCRGCLAIVLWHRRVRDAERIWTTDESSLPRIEVGPVNPLLLRHETIHHGLPGSFRILWISDLHWRNDGDARVLLGLLSIVRHTKPDAIILGGDFLDSGNSAGLFGILLRRLSSLAPCIALPGNHDSGKKQTIVRNIVTDAGATWLPDSGKVEIWNAEGDQLRVTSPSGLKKPSDGVPSLLCVHDPAELDTMSGASGACGAIAGHLHGGQWILWEKSGRFFPTVWFYPHACRRERWNGIDLIVSRGAGDTLPLRWNCPREVILLEIQ